MKILIIDNTATQRHIEQMFERKGHFVQVCSDREEGLGLLEALKPDLVVMHLEEWIFLTAQRTRAFTDLPSIVFQGQPYNVAAIVDGDQSPLGTAATFAVATC